MDAQNFNVGRAIIRNADDARQHIVNLEKLCRKIQYEITKLESYIADQEGKHEELVGTN